ncbi:MAG: hypothetical protein WC901_03850 [Candidatus Margulisiibacteriota bacterium]
MNKIKAVTILLSGLICLGLASGAFAIAQIPVQSAVNPAGTYMVYGTQGTSPMVKIVDISDPTAPRTVKTFTSTDGIAGSIYGVAFTADGTRAIFTMNSCYLGILDFSSGTYPTTCTIVNLSTLSTGSPQFRGIAINQDFAFIADNRGYVHVLNVLDVSNPASISSSSIKSIAVGSGALCVAVKPDGTRLAVSKATSPGYVYVYDLADLYSGGTPSSSDLKATIIGSSLGGSTTMDEPTYLFYGESRGSVAVMSSNSKVYLYVKNGEELSTQPDVLAFDSANDSYALVGQVNLAEAHGFTRDFTADSMQGFSGFGLSANRQYGYVAVYNATDSDHELYRFSNSISLSRTFPGSGVDSMASELISPIDAIDSVAAGYRGLSIWGGNSVNGTYAYYSLSSSGYATSETGFTQPCPLPPTITYPLISTSNWYENVDVTANFSWEAANDSSGRFAFETITYDIDYIQAANIQTNNWQDWADDVSSTHHALSDLTVGNSYFVRVRAYDGIDHSAFVYTGPFTVTQESNGLGEDGVWQMIDDFDDHTVSWTEGGYSHGSDFSGMYGNMNDIDFDGDQEWSVSNYKSTGSNGYWQGTLNTEYTQMDLASYDAIAIDVKGDGSSNTFQIQLIEYHTGCVWELPSKLSLQSTSWQTIEVSRSGMYIVEGEETPYFTGKITGYRIKYSSSEAGIPATPGPHNFDNLRAINTQSPEIPGPMVDLTVLMHGFYDSATNAQAVAIVEIECRRTDLGASNADVNTIVGTYSNVTLDSSGKLISKLCYLPEGSYYLVVRHVLINAPRNANHLAVMTAVPVSLSYTGTYPVDFSAAGTAYNNGEGLEPMYFDGSKYLIRTGDAIGLSGTAATDEYINTTDFEYWYAHQALAPEDATWVIEGDFNGDGSVNTEDFELWYVDQGNGTQVP